MRTRLAAAVAAVVLGVTVIGGCSVGDDKQSATLRDMQQRSEEIGNNLLDQLDGQLAPDQVAPDSRVASDEDEAPSRDHGRRYWRWHTRVTLADDATITPQQGADELIARLTDKGWTARTPDPSISNTTDLRTSDDYGPWLVSVTPVQHTVDITVISPVTTKD